MAASLVNQSCLHDDVEVIFVDDGSTDGTAQFLRQLELPFRWTAISQHNKGRAAARNAGIAKAVHELLIFTDDDVLLCPEFIAAHVDMQEQQLRAVHGRTVNLAHLKFFADPTHGVFYPEVAATAAHYDALREQCLSEADVRERFDQKVSCYQRRSAIERIIETVLTREGAQAPWIGFIGGNMAVHKAWVEQAGGFDEGFGRSWGCEDVELGYRLFNQNRPFGYCPQATNYHLAHYRRTFDAEHSETSAYFYEKHHDENILLFHKFVTGGIGVDAFMRWATGQMPTMGTDHPGA